MKLRSLPALLWLCCAGLLYGPLIAVDPLLNRDDLDLIRPLVSVHSPLEYFTKLSAGEIFDVNPLRDLSFKANLMAEGVPLLGNFHFGNCLVWLAICAVMYALLRKLGRSAGVAGAAVVLLSVHPALVSSVCWVAARKHLLALLFVLLATYLAVKERGKFRERVWIWISYAAATLSHPLVLLWPAWWLLYLHYERRESWKKALRAIAPTVPILLAVAAVNQWYYTGPFLRASGGFSKYVYAGFIFDPRFTLLTFGRAFLQLAAPVRVSPLEYNQYTMLNPLGLALLLVVAAAFWRIFGKRTTLVWFSPFFLAIGIVASRPTRVFLSDAYILWPAFALCVPLAAAMEKSSKKVRMGLVGLAIAGLARSIPLSRAWLSDERSVAYAYSVEPSDKTKYLRTIALLQEGRWDEALRVAEENLDYITLGRAAYAETVLRHPGIALEKKEELLAKHVVPSISYASRYAEVLALRGKYGQAYLALRPFAPVLGRFDDLAIPGFDDHGAISAELLFDCRKSAAASDCAVIERHLRAQLSAPLTASFEKRLGELQAGGP